MRFLILGAGYTGQRVAALLLREGHEVHVTSRHPEALGVLQPTGSSGSLHLYRLESTDPESIRSLAARLPSGLRALHSIPVAEGDDGPLETTASLLDGLSDRLERVVYLSTTGVYGSQSVVDETTPVAPGSERTLLRVAAEEAVQSGPWSSMVLRPAAIYGPGRGVHVAMASGRYRLAGDGSNYVSRIHVDDLARIAVAALKSDEGGAYPVADREPAMAREVAAFCAERLGLPLPPSAPSESLHETLRSSRKVDGGAVRRLLGVELLHPTWREGIAASLESEAVSPPDGA